MVNDRDISRTVIAIRVFFGRDRGIRLATTCRNWRSPWFGQEDNVPARTADGRSKIQQFRKCPQVNPAIAGRERRTRLSRHDSSW